MTSNFTLKLLNFYTRITPSRCVQISAGLFRNSIYGDAVQTAILSGDKSKSVKVFFGILPTQILISF